MASNRLKDLFHEKNTPHGGRYLTHPLKQFETLDPRSNELVHALRPPAIAALKEAGLFSSHAPTPGGTFKHQLMVSCITASIELQARDLGYGYISQQALLERADTNLVIDFSKMKNVAVDGLLIPDALFALEIDGKFLVFFLEADRGTEPERTKSMRKSWRHNLEQYHKLIHNGLYKDIFKLKAKAVLLNITISNKRRDNMVAMVSQKGCSYILSRSIPEFGRYFKPPKTMNLLDVAWMRKGYPPYKIGNT
jgi:hypothetical protein